MTTDDTPDTPMTEAEANKIYKKCMDTFHRQMALLVQIDPSFADAGNIHTTAGAAIVTARAVAQMLIQAGLVTQQQYSIALAKAATENVLLTEESVQWAQNARVRRGRQ